MGGTSNPPETPAADPAPATATDPAPAPAAANPPDSLRKRLLTWSLRLGSLGLLVLVFTQIHFWDRVTLAGGEVVQGRAERQADGTVILRDDAGTHRLAPAALAAVPPGGSPITPGFVPILKRLASEHPEAFAAFLGLFVWVVGLATLRWWLLLRAVGVRVRYRQALALYWVGLYYQNVLPAGVAAGDVVKALFLGARTGRRTQAMVSVFADRLAGLTAMVSLALAAAAFGGAGGRLPLLAPLLAAMLAGFGLLVLLLISPGLRLRLGLARLATAPVLAARFQELRRVVREYRQAHGALAAAIGLSLVSQVGLVLMNVVLGNALGLSDMLATWHYFMLIPVILIIQAVPGLPAGLGIGEAAYVVLMAPFGVPAEFALALSLVSRVSFMLLSFVGVGFVFKRRDATRPKAGESSGVVAV